MPVTAPMQDLPAHPLTVLLFPNNGLGNAEPALQLKLVGIYLGLLLEEQRLPAALCFYTEGVKLVVEGSPVLEPLKALETRGVYLISCQTCLNYYGLGDKVKVGIVGGMHDIMEIQHRAQKVITL